MLAVLSVELVSEALVVFHWHDGHLDFSARGALKDVVSTMLWPTVILLLARHTNILRNAR
jgi:hypothetical protein